MLTQGITTELIQQVRDVLAMKSTMEKKSLQAKWAKQHKSMAARRDQAVGKSPQGPEARKDVRR